MTIVATNKCGSWLLGFCHSPVDFHAYFRTLPLTPAHADAQISTGEWQKPIAVIQSRDSMINTDGHWDNMLLSELTVI